MTDAPASELLRGERLSKHYADGGVQALDAVDLTINRHDYLAIVGASGSGKSTLLNLLGALDLPTTGTVYFEGKPLAQWGSLDRFRAHKIGFVFQSFYLMPVLSAVENVQVPMFESDLPRAQRPKRALELLDRVGLGHRANHLPRQLSVGERQRVAIARALANDPPLLLADEPTGNLDSATAHAVFDLLDRLRAEQGKTIVLITHDAELAERAQRQVRIRDGRLTCER